MSNVQCMSKIIRFYFYPANANNHILINIPKKIKKDKLLAVLDKSTSGGTSGIKKLLKSVAMAK